MEIPKFRAWDSIQEKMSHHVNVYTEEDIVWWSADHIDIETGNTISSFDDKCGKLMQYISLKATNGPIYTNEILSVAYKGKTHVVVVEYSAQSAGYYFRILKTGKILEIARMAMYVDEHGFVLLNCDIIGNIFEHKHILKEQA